MSMVGRTRACEPQGSSILRRRWRASNLYPELGDGANRQELNRVCPEVQGDNRRFRLSSAVGNSDDRDGLDAASAEWLNHHGGDRPYSPLLANP
jgi:hypothetical protein